MKKRLKRYEDLLAFTTKQTIALEDIEVTYRRRFKCERYLVTASITKKLVNRKIQPCWKPRFKTYTNMSSSIVITNTQTTLIPLNEHSIVYHPTSYMF